MQTMPGPSRSPPFPSHFLLPSPAFVRAHIVFLVEIRFFSSEGKPHRAITPS